MEAIHATQAQSSVIHVATAGSATAPPITKAKVAFHFRRHTDWVGYMSLANNIAEMEYGFDWLGDKNFDFDISALTAPLAHDIESRYEYIEKHAYNSNTDISVAGNVETLMTDRCDIEKEVTVTTHHLHSGSTPVVTHPPATTTTNGNTTTTIDHNTETVVYTSATERVRYNASRVTTKAVPNLPGDILKLKTEYQQGAQLRVLGGDKYYPAYLNVRFNKTVKLICGINHLDVPPTVHFGDNNDEIHLIPKNGFEGSFTITPNKITKAELTAAGGMVEITLTNVNHSLTKIPAQGRVAEQLPSILAYHIDDNTPKGIDNKAIIVNRANIVGEMVVLPNKKYYTAECYLIRVKRSGTLTPAVAAVPPTATTPAVPAVAAVPYNDFPSAGGISNYGPFDKVKIEKALKRILAQANIAVTIIEKELLNYTGPNVVNSNGDAIKEELKAYREQEVPPTVIGATRRTALERIENSKAMFIFLHNYRASTTLTGPAMSAFSNTEAFARNEKKAGFANAAMLFNNGTHADAAHEITHTLGCHHSFITEEKERVSFPGNPLPVEAIYFKEREKDETHIFQKGRTENLMDYDFGYKYNGGISVFLDPDPPAVDNGAHRNYTTITKKRFYPIDAQYLNPNKLCGLYKWQWKVMQGDDELVSKTEIV